MSETNDPNVEEGGEKRNFRRVLEDRATDAEARAEAAENKLLNLERTEAFRKAGINPGDSRQAYFVKGYEGDYDPEAIRTAALEAGFIDAGNPESSMEQQWYPTEPEQTQPLRGELDASQRVAAASLQGQPVVPGDLNDRLRSASSVAELKALWQSEGGSINVQG